MRVISWGKKVASPDPAHKTRSVCDHDLFHCWGAINSKDTAPFKDSEKFKGKRLKILVNKFWDYLMKRNRHDKNLVLFFFFLVNVCWSRSHICLPFADEEILKLFTKDSTKEQIFRMPTTWNYAKSFTQAILLDPYVNSIGGYYHSHSIDEDAKRNCIQAWAGSVAELKVRVGPAWLQSPCIFTLPLCKLARIPYYNLTEK